MQRAFEKMRTQVQTLAGKYSDPKKRRDLDQVFSILSKELEHKQVQSQRIMPLLRAIIVAQPGSAKVVNEFLRSSAVAGAINAGGNYTLK